MTTQQFAVVAILWLIVFAVAVSLSPLGDSAEKRASRRSR